MSLTNITRLDTSSSSLDVPEPPLKDTVGPLGGTRERVPPAPVPELPQHTWHARVSTSMPCKPVAKDEDGSDSGSSAGRSTTPGPSPQLDYVQISRTFALEGRETRNENAHLREQIRALHISSEAARSHSAPVDSSGPELSLHTSVPQFWPCTLVPPDVCALMLGSLIKVTTTPVVAALTPRPTPSRNPFLGASIFREGSPTPTPRSAPGPPDLPGPNNGGFGGGPPGPPPGPPPLPGPPGGPPMPGAPPYRYYYPGYYPPPTL